MARKWFFTETFDANGGGQIDTGDTSTEANNETYADWAINKLLDKIVPPACGALCVIVLWFGLIKGHLWKWIDFLF